MEKISGIVPGSSRVTSVNLSDQRPVRASVPNFGQRVTASSPKGPQKSGLVEGMEVWNELYGPDARRVKENQETVVAKRMSEEFFKNQAQLPGIVTSKQSVKEISLKGIDEATDSDGESGMEVDRPQIAKSESEAPRKLSIRA
jgi:hypothetical protein